MRILLIHNEYLQNGGEDTVFRSEQELLRSRGHLVETLVFSNSDIQSRLDKMIYSLKSIYNRESYERVQRKIRAFKPDIIHVHNFFYVASPAIFYAASSLGVPVVMTLHNYRLICPSAYLYHNGEIFLDSIHQLFPFGAVRRRVWHNSLPLTATIALGTGIHKLLRTFRWKVDAFLVFTEFSRDLFLNSSLGVREDALYIKPNFAEDRGANTGERRGDFLFVGRLSEEKGIHTLLEAVKRNPFPLTIIGDGPLRDLVEETTATISEVRYAGSMPHEEVLARMKDARALLFPSRWYEGMPMVILEAMAAGTPVLASRLGNPEAMITSGHNGLLFEPGNPAALLEAVGQLAENPALIRKLSAGARATWEQHYSPDKNYEALVRIYRQVILKKNKKD